jgi:hypothetical protein
MRIVTHDNVGEQAWLNSRRAHQRDADGQAEGDEARCGVRLSGILNKRTQVPLARRSGLPEHADQPISAAAAANWAL